MLPEPGPAIEVTDLRKVYGDKAAVDGLTLRVERGCFFGFLGPNGAGKTTTIRMLMGLAPATSGTIRILGHDMPGDAVAIKSKIGLVPDDTLLFDHLTGGEFIEFVGRMYGLGRDLAHRNALYAEGIRTALDVWDYDGKGGPLTLTAFLVQHGNIPALGYRIGDAAYTPDLHDIPEESWPALEGLDLWIVDGLRYAQHPSHFSVRDALKWIDRFKPKRTVITNMHSDLDYEVMRKELPSGVIPAYDGMRLALSSD